MDKKFDDGGNLFPMSIGCTSDKIFTSDDFEGGEGATLWDYYAAHAPNEALYYGPSTGEFAARELGIDAEEYNNEIHFAKLIGFRAANYADIMLEERKKRFG